MSQDEGTQPGDNVQSDTEVDDFEPKGSVKDYAEKWRNASAEAKKYRKEVQSLKAKIDEFEQSKLQAEGKKDEMIQKLQARLKDSEEKQKKVVGTFAHKIVTKEVEKEALKRGCIKPDALIKLADLSTIDIDDDFNVSGDSIKDLLDRMQKENDFLFKKEVITPKDGMPKGFDGKEKKKAVKDMTKEEKMALLLQSRS